MSTDIVTHARKPIPMGRINGMKISLAPSEVVELVTCPRGKSAFEHHLDALVDRARAEATAVITTQDVE